MRSRITGSRPFEKTTVAYESLHATLSSRSTAEMLRQFATTGGQGPEASKHVGGSDKIHVIQHRLRWPSSYLTKHITGQRERVK